ncbi:MAG: hypothetical protein QG665_273, partial [Patescibacteria group bacterium]|nr:hypothetical protein [Patescibacteria group bacterium]
MKYILRFLILAVLVVAPGYALAAPSIRVVTGPNNVTVGQSSTWSFTYNSTAPAGEAPIFGFNPGDGTGNKSAVSPSSPTFNYAFNLAGTYT